MAINFEGLIACGIEYFHHSIGMHFMNYERTRPPGFQFSWKKMKFRIIKQDSLSQNSPHSKIIKKTKLNQTKIKLKQEIKIKTSLNLKKA